MDFNEKVVIVTGASSGIGAAAATQFANHGARLTLVAKNDTKLQKVAKACTVNGKQHMPLTLDLTQPGNCEKVICMTVETFGRIDVLVNCASKIAFSSLFDETMDVFDELMAINFRVPYKLTQLSIPYLLKTKGNIVNVGSSMTKRWKNGILPYAVSKNALERFTKLGAAELSSVGVRINSISPGITKANLLASLNVSKSCSDYINKTIKDNNFPIGKVIESEEVATLICLAASDVFPNLSGSNLTLDGGASMA